MMKSRQSNIELLRVLAMFMVLVLHAIGSLEWPQCSSVGNVSTGVHVVLSALQSVSVVAVNVFVLISGWFGIRPTLRGAGKLVFQCVFISLIVYGALVAANIETLTAKGVFGCISLDKTGWFVKSYLALFVLSPVLNMFSEHAERRQQEVFLLSFYGLQTVLDWLFRTETTDINNGFSLFSFVGLYLLARYVRRFQMSRINRLPTYLFISVFAGIAIVYVAAGSGVFFLFGVDVFHRMMLYSSPLVIVQSVALLLFFTRLSFSSKAVNGVAAGCLAVYLIHQYPAVCPLYSRLCREVFLSQSSVAGIVFLLGFLCLVYIACILVDVLRLLFWNLCTAICRRRGS